MEITRTALAVAAVEAAAKLCSGSNDLDVFKNAVKTIEGKLVATFEADTDAQKRATHLATASRGGGYRKGGGGQQGPVGDIKFKGTKFDGKSIEETYKMGASEAFSNHKYQDQNGDPQPGKNFVEWLATKDGYMAEKCKAYLDGLKASASTDTTPAPTEANTTETKSEDFDFDGGSSW